MMTAGGMNQPRQGQQSDGLRLHFVWVGGSSCAAHVDRALNNTIVTGLSYIYYDSALSLSTVWSP